METTEHNLWRSTRYVFFFFLLCRYQIYILLLFILLFHVLFRCTPLHAISCLSLVTYVFLVAFNKHPCVCVWLCGFSYLCLFDVCRTQQDLIRLFMHNHSRSWKKKKKTTRVLWTLPVVYYASLLRYSFWSSFRFSQLLADNYSSLLMMLERLSLQNNSHFRSYGSFG